MRRWYVLVLLITLCFIAFRLQPLSGVSGGPVVRYYGVPWCEICRDFEANVLPHLEFVTRATENDECESYPALRVEWPRVMGLPRRIETYPETSPLDLDSVRAWLLKYVS